jgi:cation diffusion facilitator family transporter
MTDRTRLIKRVSWIAIGGNAALAILKITAGFISGSLSVVADGTDSAGDVMISVVTLFIAYLLVKPPNLRFPYGYAKAEANATVVVSFVIFFAGAQLAISSLKRIIAGSIVELPGSLAIIAVVVSIVVKFILSWYQSYIGRKINSRMLIANAKNMQSDVIISFSVLLGLLFTHFLKIPSIDSIVALLVSLWVIWVAIRIFIETNMELMDGNIERNIYEQVFEIIERIPEASNPHRMRIRRAGSKLMINIDIELDGEMSLAKAHEISHKIEKKIKEGLDYEVFDVIIHIEPFGDDIHEETIGISRDVLDASNMNARSKEKE